MQGMNTLALRVPNGPEICFDRLLIERYGGRGPRYTSYPTALQFSDEVNADGYRRNALASNASAAPLSLYVHIPFCRSLCYYCGCNKVVTRNQTRVKRYLDRLHRELRMQGELFSHERKVEQVHFGGGTPTYLDARQLNALMADLRGAFSFDDSDEREFSIEIDPRTVDGERIRELWGLGFNRLSLGIQDFDPVVQKAVNRTQPTAKILRLLVDARRAGFESISFDLIYGLPFQTIDSFDQTLDLVIGMQPDRLAVYNYAHLPQRFKGQRMIDEAALPQAALKLEILHRTIDRLGDAGYVYIGMDHFALPGDALVRARLAGSLQRNFQGYSTHGDCDLVGLGASAISRVGNVYAQNAVTTAVYETLIGNGQLAIQKGIVVDSDDRLRAAVIQVLMCHDRLSFDTFEARHGVNFARYFKRELERLQPLVRDGLTIVDRDGISITPKGRLLLRSIAMIFDRYIETELPETRFSKAI